MVEVGGMIRPAGKDEYPSYKFTTGSDKKGVVVKKTGADTVDIAGAGEKPFGITLEDTKHPRTEAVQKDQYVPIADIGQNGAVVSIPLLATNAAIAVGDYLGTAAGGTVNKITWRTDTLANFIADMDDIVAVALEAKPINSGGYIKALLFIPRL